MDYKKKFVILIILFIIIIIFLDLKKINNKNVIINNISKDTHDTVYDINNEIENVIILFDDNGDGKKYVLTEDELIFRKDHPDYNPEPSY